MPRPCSVCALPAADREAVEAAYLTAEPYRAVALRAGVSRDAVARHRRHVAASVRAATDAAARVRGDGLLDRLDALDSEAREVGRDAKAAGDRKGRLGAVRERTRIVELRARLAGELRDGAQVNVLVAVADSGDDLTADDLIAAEQELAERRAALALPAPGSTGYVTPGAVPAGASPGAVSADVTCGAPPLPAPGSTDDVTRGASEGRP